MLIAALASALMASALMMASAQAQMSGGQMGQHGSHGRKQPDKSESPKPKVDEKAYSAALHSLPDKKYDPWHGVR